MTIASRAFGAAFACVLLASSASAQVTDPEMTCADYLKTAASTGGTPKTGDAAMDKMAADVDARIKASCAANPKMKEMDAEMTVMGD
jgi:hypothetical protein